MLGVGTGSVSILQTQFAPPQVRRPPEIPQTLVEPEESPANRLLRRNEKTVLRGGFGRDTVSSPGMAVRTLGMTFQATRRILPTYEEQLREQRAERAESEPSAYRQRQVRRLNPVANLRGFIGAVNRAAGSGQEADGQAEGGQATLTVNGTDFPLRRAGGQGPVLDVSV